MLVAVFGSLHKKRWSLQGICIRIRLIRLVGFGIYDLLFYSVPEAIHMWTMGIIHGRPTPAKWIPTLKLMGYE